MVLPNDNIKDLLCHYGENNHHQSADDRASNHAERDPWIPLQIAKYAPNRFHRAQSESGVLRIRATQRRVIDFRMPVEKNLPQRKPKGAK
jgi:hypothetical protein